MSQHTDALFFQIVAIVAGLFTLGLAAALALGYWSLTVGHSLAPWLFALISRAAMFTAARLRAR